MSGVKDRMTDIVAAQPEDSSFEEILRELAFAHMVERGLLDSRDGKVLSNEEVRRRSSHGRNSLDPRSGPNGCKRSSSTSLQITRTPQRP
jgi:hypothetical protein